MSTWQPMDTAPKGGGADVVTDPAWIEPPEILIRTECGKHAVVRWDWYYAQGGRGCSDGIAWVINLSGETLSMAGYKAAAWMPVP